MTTNVKDATEKVRKSVPGDEAVPAESPLQEAVQRLVGTVTDRAVSAAADKVLNATGRLTEYAEGGGGGLLAAVTGAEKLAGGASPMKAALSAGVAGAKQTVKDKASELKDKITGGGGGKTKKKKQKITNIIEAIDVGVPVQVAYDEWTQFESFPHFMKKLNQVEQVSDEKVRWKAQVFWSHRSWESTIVEQVPAERIVWRSTGDKGYLDGAVTFHELAPDLTRIMVVLEYRPRGLFEKTGNIWRAQGRRIRLELKNFQRHVMTQSILNQDEIEGWPGEIRDSKVVDYGEPEESEESEERGEDEPSPDDEDLGDAAVDSELDERDEAVDSELDERDEPEREGEDADSDEDFAQERPKRPARAGRSRSSSGARREQGERV